MLAIEDDFMFFCKAEDYEARKVILFNKKHLLSNKSSIIILQLIEENIFNEITQINMIEHHELLKRIIALGHDVLLNFKSINEIEAAFIHFSSELSDQSERKSYLKENMYLAEDRSLGIIKNLVKRFTKELGNNATSQLRLYRNLIISCTLMPTEIAFEMFQLPSERMFNAINAFIKINSHVDIFTSLGRYSSEVKDPKFYNAIIFMQAFYNSGPLSKSLKSFWEPISTMFHSDKEMIWFEE